MRFIALVVLILIISGCNKTLSNGTQPTSQESLGTCQLELRFNGRAPDKDIAVPVYYLDRVLSVMQSAEKAGQIELQFVGSGKTAFVTAINRVENERAQGDNWVYRVNDQLGNQSCAIYPVLPGDRITWSFGKYNPDDQSTAE